MRNDDGKSGLIFSLFGIIPVIWLALLTAPYLAGGLPEILRGLADAMNHPFHIRVCGDSVKTVLLFLAAYGLGTGIYLSTRRKYRRGDGIATIRYIIKFTRSNIGVFNKIIAYSVDIIAMVYICKIINFT